MGTTFYGYGFILDCFFILDVDKHELSNYSCYSLMATTRNSCDDMILWHARQGHIGQERMNRLARENLLGQFTKINITTCEYCLARKLTRKPFGIRTKAETTLQLIHSNFCGPMSVKARHDALYFISFIDDFTHYGHTFFISHKAEALDCFKCYINLVENQLDKRVKALRIDQGRKYLSKQFKILCDEKGIRRQLTIPGTPQQNSIVEMRNRTLLDMVDQ